MKFATQSVAGLFLKNNTMDTRKIQITGKSTFIITLPKKWVTSTRLTAGTELGFSYQEDGSVLLVPPNFREERTVKKVSAEKDIAEIKRDIVALYVLGNCNSIEIHSEWITNEKREKIQKLCKKLVGYEIVESSGRRILIQNLLNTREITMEKTVKRMFSIVFLMFEDMLRTLKENNVLQREELIARHIDLERAYLFVSKMYVEKMDIKKVSLKDELNLIHAFYYRLTTENVYNIGEIIMEMAPSIENQYIKNAPVEGMVEIFEHLKEIFRDSFESFKLADCKMANNVISRCMELDDTIKMTRGQNCTSTVCYGENVFDSITRLIDQNSKIAKLSIEISHLQS